MIIADTLPSSSDTPGAPRSATPIVTRRCMPLRGPAIPSPTDFNSLIGPTLSPLLHVVSFCCKSIASPAIGAGIQCA